MWATARPRCPGVEQPRSACYARIQQPGTSGYDGYMLRTNQLAGHRPGLPRARRQRHDRHRSDRQPGALGRRRLPPARQGSTPRGLAQRRLDLVAPRRRAGLDLRGGGLRRHRHARHHRRLDDFGVRTLGRRRRRPPPPPPRACRRRAGNAAGHPELDRACLRRRLADPRATRSTARRPRAPETQISHHAAHGHLDLLHRQRPQRTASTYFYKVLAVERGRSPARSRARRMRRRQRLPPSRASRPA